VTVITWIVGRKKLWVYKLLTGTGLPRCFSHALKLNKFFRVHRIRIILNTGIEVSPSSCDSGPSFGSQIPSPSDNFKFSSPDSKALITLPIRVPPNWFYFSFLIGFSSFISLQLLFFPIMWLNLSLIHQNHTAPSFHRRERQGAAATTERTCCFEIILRQVPGQMDTSRQHLLLPLALRPVWETDCSLLFYHR
jgi:hypothetical protein